MKQYTQKKIVLRFRAVNRDIFQAIKTGRKRVETRAATKRYRGLDAGDEIMFVCGKERFKKTAYREKLKKYGLVALELQ